MLSIRKGILCIENKWNGYHCSCKKLICYGFAKLGPICYFTFKTVDSWRNVVYSSHYIQSSQPNLLLLLLIVFHQFPYMIFPPWTPLLCQLDIFCTHPITWGSNLAKPTIDCCTKLNKNRSIYCDVTANCVVDWLDKCSIAWFLFG